MARRKKETPITQADLEGEIKEELEDELEDGMAAKDREALEQDETKEALEDETKEEELSFPNPNQAKLNLVEEKQVKLPRRDLGGMYKCLCRVSHDNKILSPGTELKLSDVEARHYLKSKAIEALD